MAEARPQPTPGVVTIACPYCGATDTLPHEAGARANALRARLRELRWAQDSLSGQDAIVCQLLEQTWLPHTLKAAMGPLSIFIVMGAGMTYAVGDIRGLFIAGPMALALLLLVGGMVTGFLVAKRRYREKVRPWILARVPVSGGAPARCHCCGGALSAQPEPFMRCPFCGATNLVTPELAQRRAQDLERDAAAFRARAQGAAVRVGEHVAYVRRAITIGYYVPFGLMLFLLFAGAPLYALGHWLIHGR